MSNAPFLSARRHLSRSLILACSVALPLGLGACSSKPENAPASHSAGAAPSDPGAAEYVKSCAICHGKNGSGSSMNLGPSLKGVAEHWDVESLLEYIDDPKAYSAKVERLGKREMAAISDSVTPEQRRALVEYTLTLMD